MNRVVLIGRLTKDIDVRYTTTQKVVATFSLAVTREFKNPQGEYETDFFNVVMWGKPAELAGNTLKKGNKIAIDGRIQNRSYEAKDGTKRYVTEIIANGFEYLEKREQPKDMASMGTDVTKNMPFDEEVPF